MRPSSGTFTQYSMDNSTRSSQGTFAAMAMVLPLLIANGIVVFYFAWLRETPMFWHSEGGYPAWLRDTVFETFYPLLALQLFLLGVQSLALLRHPPRAMFWWMTEACTLTAVWFVLGTTMLLVGLNNVDNFMNGRDLHDHLAMHDSQPSSYYADSGE